MKVVFVPFGRTVLNPDVFLEPPITFLGHLRPRKWEYPKNVDQEKTVFNLV